MKESYLSWLTKMAAFGAGVWFGYSHVGVTNPIIHSLNPPQVRTERAYREIPVSKEYYNIKLLQKYLGREQQ
ncbi:MAG: hypothetical protein ACOCWQ_03270 [Nanoarchaeota archaeon]